jgi:cytoskeleton protein RodZ
MGLIEDTSIMSSSTEQVAAPRVGADLAAARERLGYSLPEIAGLLRIRAPYLAALEEGRVGELPGNAYALAFLRSYAAALGLDPDELSRRFKAEAAEVSRKTDLVFPAPVPERGLPAGAIVLLGVVLAIGAYAGWYRLSGEGRLPPETVPPVPARLAPLADQTPPAPVPSVAVASPGGTVASPAAGSTAPAEPAPVSRQAAIVPPDQPVSPSSAAAATPAGSQSVGGALSGTVPQQGVLVRASVDSWIQVRQRGGQVLFSRILHAGESWPVPDTPNLLLTTGNAGGTELVLDGTPGAPLGGMGVVRRDLPLDPDAIRGGRLTSVAPTPR